MIRRMLGDSAVPDDVQTASDGRFAMRIVEGKWDLNFRREGFAPYRASSVDVKPGVAPVEVTLQPGAEIVGRVVRAGGAGVDAVQVSTMGAGGFGNATTGPDGGLLAIAGAAGGGATMLAAWRGWGTIFRGPGAAAGAVVVDAAGVDVAGVFCGVLACAGG